MQRVDRRGLVRPEAVDAARFQPLDDLGMERARERRRPSFPGRQLGPVDEPARELGIRRDLRERVAGIHAVDVTTWV